MVREKPEFTTIGIRSGFSEIKNEPAMTATKIKVECFDEKGDFGLWRRRMHAILVQQRVAKALEGENKLPGNLTVEQKSEMLEMAFNTLTLHLDDKVLQEVSSETIATRL